MRQNPCSQPSTVEAAGPFGSPGLKAERINLKAERVELALRDLPGWHLHRQARQIARSVELAEAQQASRLLQRAVDLGIACGQMPGITLQAGVVTFTLPTMGGSALAAEHFALAKALEESV